MSTAVNRETIKRKREEEGVGWGGVGWWWGGGGVWKPDSENRGRQSMQNGT